MVKKIPNIKSATRLSSFAIISSIEEDLRDFIYLELGSNPTQDIVHEELLNSSLLRYEKDTKLFISADTADLYDILHYTDIGDLNQILNRQKDKLTISNDDRIQIDSIITKIIAPRNRVCHSRPLEADDFLTILDSAKHIVGIPVYTWDNIKKALSLLESDPSFINTLAIPSFWKDNENSCKHNLPLGEFDDTGFVGRVKEKNMLQKLVLSPHPVLNITGKGGIGKTALLVKVLYDILDSQNNPFNYIVWVSLKTNVLTSNGIKTIKNSIFDVSGIEKAIGNFFQKDEGNGFDEVLSEMKELPILLVIDNLETISDYSLLRNFLGSIPYHSKVVITSRIGLGEYEERFPLDDLSDSDAVILLRKCYSIYQLSSLFSMRNETLLRTANSLYNSPLAIKWYASSVARGMDPNIFRSLDQKTNLLTFCFSNLFERLSEEELIVLYSLIFSSRKLLTSEISYISGFEDTQLVRNIIQNLFSSNLIERSHTEDTNQNIVTQYTAARLTKDYVKSFNSIPKKIMENVHQRFHDLERKIESMQVSQNTYAYKLTSITLPNENYKIAALNLYNAILFSRKRDWTTSKIYIEKAKNLSPDFIECYTVAAYIFRKEGNILAAKEEYEKALELDPNSSKVHFFYSQLERSHLNYEKAFLHLEKAIENAREGDDTTPLLQEKMFLLNLMGKSEESISFFENHIEHLHATAKEERTRIDFLSRAYKDYCLHLIESNSMEKAFSVIQKPIRKIVELKKEANIDDYLMDRFKNLVDLCMRICLKTQNTAFVNITVGHLQEYFSSMRTSKISLYHLDYFKEAFNIDEKKLGQPIDAVTKEVGEIKFFDKTKDFGFIVSKGRDYYFHGSGMPISLKSSLQPGAMVSFSISEQGKNKVSAIHIKLVSNR